MKGGFKSYARRYERNGAPPRWIANFDWKAAKRGVFLEAWSEEELELKLSAFGLKLGKKTADWPPDSAGPFMIEYDLEEIG